MKNGYIYFMILFFLVNLISVPINVLGTNEEEYFQDITRSSTVVKDNITKNTTWLRDNSPYYIENTIHILNHSTLTIEPGVEIIFNHDSKIIVGSVEERGGGDYESDSLISNGRHFSQLIANGTLENRISFKSNEALDSSLTGRILSGLFSKVIFRFSGFYSTGGIAIIGSDNSEIYQCNFYDTGYILIDEAEVDSLKTYPSNNTIWKSNFISNFISIKIKSDSETYPDPENRIYLNNYINNTFPVIIDRVDKQSRSIWNDSAGHGNYWSDYNGTDLDNDGIGDTNLPWHGVDWVPLMKPSPAINNSNQSWLGKPPDYDPDDKDGDGLPDAWEKAHGLDPTDPTDALKDSDNDGLMNTAEYKNNTGPLFDDTDYDHMKDKWEIDHGLDPTDPSDAHGDIDNDGLSNLAEIWNNTDPFSNDTDGDGIPDGWEIINGLEPLNASDAQFDFDNDGLTNLQEYEVGTDPNNPKSITLDRDGDGVLNTDDAYPDDPNRWEKEVSALRDDIGWWIPGVAIALVFIGIIFSVVVVWVKRGKRKDEL